MTCQLLLLFHFKVKTTSSHPGKEDVKKIIGDLLTGTEQLLFSFIVPSTFCSTDNIVELQTLVTQGNISIFTSSGSWPGWVCKLQCVFLWFWLPVCLPPPPQWGTFNSFISRDGPKIRMRTKMMMMKVTMTLTLTTTRKTTKPICYIPNLFLGRSYFCPRHSLLSNSIQTYQSYVHPW